MAVVRARQSKQAAEAKQAALALESKPCEKSSRVEENRDTEIEVEVHQEVAEEDESTEVTEEREEADDDVSEDDILGDDQRSRPHQRPTRPSNQRRVDPSPSRLPQLRTWLNATRRLEEINTKVEALRLAVKNRKIPKDGRLQEAQQQLLDQLDHLQFATFKCSREVQDKRREIIELHELEARVRELKNRIAMLLARQGSRPTTRRANAPRPRQPRNPRRGGLSGFSPATYDDIRVDVNRKGGVRIEREISKNANIVIRLEVLTSETDVTKEHIADYEIVIN